MIDTHLPSRIVWTSHGPEVEWLATDGRRYEEPFFEQTLRALSRLDSNTGRAPVRTPIDALSAAASGLVPAAFIFHVSRCGSTLVCRMLAGLDDSLVISEAAVLDDVLRGRRDDPTIEIADRVAWLRGAVAALGRAVPGARRAFVKLDGWHIFELPLVRRAFPDTPFVFVFRDPLEVLVSLSRSPSIALVRGTVSPDELGIPWHVRDELTRDQLAAAVLGAYYRTAQRYRAELTPFAYERLPDAIWQSMPGCTFGEDEIDRMRAAARQDAKDPARPFQRDSEAKRRDVTPALGAACARWASDAYAEWLAAIARESPAGAGKPITATKARSGGAPVPRSQL